jgi:hypothetical protein
MRDVRLAVYLCIALHFSRKIWDRCNRKPSSENEFMRMYNLNLDKFKESIAKSAGIPVDRVFAKVSDRPFLGQLYTSTVGLVRQTPGDLDKLLAFPDGNETREFKVLREFFSATSAKG